MSRCEAMVLVLVGTSERYVCCGAEDAHLHHKLTRARGGLILDAVNETYHHMYLCARHHAIAHDAPAMENGLLIAGMVVSRPDGSPIYTGPDPYLTEHYGASA